MKNLEINMEKFKNKHKLSLLRVLVCGTIAFNTLTLCGCGENIKEILTKEDSLETDGTLEYFNSLVEVKSMYIDCDNLSQEIKNKEEKLPSTFYDTLNSCLENGKCENLIFRNDRGIIDYSKINLDKVESVSFENCFVYDCNGNYIFKDPTSDYIDLVMEIDGLFENIYIDCDEFPEKIRKKEEQVPSTFYDILNSHLENKECKSIVFRNDKGIIDYSKINLDKIESVNFEKCFVYDCNGNYIFKDPTSDYIDLVIDSNYLSGIIYINCDNFPKEIKEKQEQIPSTFYDILNSHLENCSYNSITFFGDNEVIDYSRINYSCVKDISFEDSIGESSIIYKKID